jgi:CRP-like cAMP-binding protein
MDTSLILKNAAKHIMLSADETDFFTSLLVEKQVAKKTTLQAEGQLCKTISYVHSGALRAYCTDKDGKEATIMFAMADWWVTDMFCFLNTQPAIMNIEAVENSCILQLSKKDFDRLFVQIPAFEKFFRVLMQNAYTREQLRTIENLTLTAEERYERFTNKYPQVIKQVTQKQIASYLGITPEFLSSIRNKKAKG